MRGKKLLCGLLALVMALVMLPAHRLAEAAAPKPASGTHVKWIDRIANLPDYARTFYSWLEKNATATGALSDPTLGTNIGGVYVHQVHTIEGTAKFACTANDDLEKMAMDAAVAHAGDAHNVAIDYIFDVFGAFDRDHPEVFWLNRESLCGSGISISYTTDGGIAEVDYKLSIYFYLKSDDHDVRLAGYRDPTVIASAIQKRDQDIQRILADCPVNEPVEAQLRYLNKVLTQTNAYNSAVASGNGSAADPTAWKCVSALSGFTGTKGPVCEGYARAFKVLCDRLGIPCVLNEGYARNSASAKTEAHMWNYVQVEGSWYAVDVTWNDPTVSSKPNAALSGKEQEKWFLLGSDTEVSNGLSFIASHPVLNEVNTGGTCYTNGPVLAKNAYGAKEDPAVPDSTVPTVTEPKPTTPKPTQPKPTEPKPTEPEIVIPDNLMDIAPYRGGDVYTAPEKDGYVFAGWFVDPELTEPLDESVTTGSAYARFVDAQTLTVKCQLTKGTTAASSQADLRLLTGIDSAYYQYVFFVVQYGETEKRLVSDRMYEQLLVNDKPLDSASKLFGKDAARFMACTLPGITQDSFDMEITVIPGWCTMDGTVVIGKLRNVRVSDGY